MKQQLHKRHIQIFSVALGGVFLYLCLSYKFGYLPGAIFFQNEQHVAGSHNNKPESSHQDFSTYDYAKNLGFNMDRYANLTRDNYFQLLKPIDIQNASAVFNSINSVLDGPAGTLQPNGVSVFTGYIPEGTFFYHGTLSRTGMPDSPEWVGMHWEYSYAFAHGTNMRRPDGTGHNGPGGPRGPGGPGGPLPGEGGPGNPGGTKADSKKWPPFHDAKVRARLFTFQNVKPLNRVIVMEGASAKKEDDGTMDVHNVLASTNYTQFFGEHERELAVKMCDWGKKAYGGLDGIVRMEVGFEMIVCDFSSNKLQLVSNDTFLNELEILDFPTPFLINDTLMHEDEANNLSKREISHEDRVLDDIRFRFVKYLPNVKGWENYVRHYEEESRIKIDYRGFTSPLNKTYLSPDTYLRRLRDTLDEVRREFVENLEKVYSKNADIINYWDGNDWQKYTKHIVSKFFTHLYALNKTYELYYENPSNLSALGVNVSLATFQYYTRYQAVELANVTEREAKGLEHAIFEHTFPKQKIQSEADVLIWSSIAQVVKSISEELFAQLNLAKKILQIQYNKKGSNLGELRKQIDERADKLHQLIENLDWTVVYGCKEKCPPESICYIPTWGPSPLWGFQHTGKGRELIGGVYRIKKQCDCISVNDAFGYPSFAFR